MQLNEAIADVLRAFHNGSCYPRAEDFEIEAAVNKIFAAIESGGYVIIQTKRAAHAIVGRAPLNLEGVDGGQDEFAVYIDGLTAEEAGALMPALMTTREG